MSYFKLKLSPYELLKFEHNKLIFTDKRTEFYWHGYSFGWKLMLIILA